MHHYFAIVLLLLCAATVNAQSSSAASTPARSAASSPVAPPTAPVVHASQPTISQSKLATVEFKDYALAAGVIVTLILGVWNALANHHFNSRTTFVNTVTSQRIQWIEQLRQDIASYSGLVFHWSSTDLADKTEERQIFKDIDRLQHVIRLRLNPTGNNDKTIERLLDEIPNQAYDQTKVRPMLEELTKASQRLLKEEWEKVKHESKHGPSSERA